MPFCLFIALYLLSCLSNGQRLCTKTITSSSLTVKIGPTKSNLFCIFSLAKANCTPKYWNSCASSKWTSRILRTRISNNNHVASERTIAEFRHNLGGKRLQNCIDRLWAVKGPLTTTIHCLVFVEMSHFGSLPDRISNFFFGIR